MSLKRGRFRSDTSSGSIRGWIEEKLRWVEREVDINRRVLDIGCGPGIVLRRIERAATLACGIDSDLGVLREAKAETNADLVLADARYLPFTSQAFDVVLMFAVLHEVKSMGGDPGAELALREAARVLVSGGKLLASDFVDPGEEPVVVSIEDALPALRKFSRRFKLRKVSWSEVECGLVRISKRDLQDFASKADRLDEEFEMRETHVLWTASRIVKLLDDMQLQVVKFETEGNLEELLERLKIKLLDRWGWNQHFSLIAKKLE